MWEQTSIKYTKKKYGKKRISDSCNFSWALFFLFALSKSMDRGFFFFKSYYILYSIYFVFKLYII